MSQRVAGADRRIVAAVLFAGFIAGWDATSLFFIYPDIRDGLADGDAASASWVLSITNIVSAALLLQAGRMADRLGHRKVFLAGAMIYSAAGLVAVVAPGLWVLVGARGAMAAGLSVMGPASMAILLASTAPEGVSAAMGRWGLATAVAGVLGPIAVSSAVDVAGWRLTFALQIPLALVMVFLTAGSTADDRPDPTVTIRPFDSVIAVAGLTLAILPIVEGNDWGWTSPGTLGCFGASAVVLSVLVARSGDTTTAPLPLDLFRRRSFTVAVLISISAGIAFFAQWLAMLLYLTEVWGYGLVPASLLLTIMPGSMTLLAVAAGRWSDRWGVHRVMIPGASFYVLAFGLFWLRAGTEPNLLLLVPALVSGGVGLATVWPGITAAGTVGIERRRLGVASAVIQTTQRVGAAVGVALVVALVASGVGDEIDTQHLRAVALLPLAGFATALLATRLRPTPAAREVVDPARI